MLICKFASPRSSPTRIRGWISYLDQLAAHHASDTQAVDAVKRLKEQAMDWLAQHPSAART